MNDPYCDAIVAQTVASSMDGYKKLLNRGAARECARAVLPMASRTVMYMTGTLRSWLHYAILRSKPNTQKEHRLIAEAVIPILAWQFPITCNASVEVAKEDYIKKTRVKDQRDRLLSIATDMWIYGRNRNNESAPKWREAQERFESLEKEIMEHDNGQS
jgi:thymidylate synthase ThyX